MLEITNNNSQKEENINLNTNLKNERRIRKKCIGCLDDFTCFFTKNYDYCRNCEINGNRYINKKSPCSECDGSGLVKFPNQPPRNCKLCYLANQEQREDKFFAKYA